MTTAEISAQLEAAQGRIDSMGDMSNEMQISIQLQQERYTKAFQTLSNIMKKFSDTMDAMVANLK